MPIGLRLDEELLARVDAAKGDVPRSRWIARACEAALAAEPAVMGMPVRVDERVERDHVVVVPTERPVYRQHVPGPSVENIRSSGQAKRDVRPVPKGKS